MDNGRTVTKEELVRILEIALKAVKEDDSFQGNIYYEVDGPDTFYVQAMVRVGNSEGQGGTISILNEEE